MSSKTKHRTVWIDGVLYFSIAVLVFLQGYFSTEEAYKYCSPFVLFWLKAAVGALGAGAGALKMFRSQTFANHVKSEQAPPEKIQL